MRCESIQEQAKVYQRFGQLSLILLILCSSCGSDYAPKPHGFFRIKLPEKKYQAYHDSGCPFRFSFPVYAKIEKDKSPNAQPCWFDLVFPSFNARLHLSYYRITSPHIFNELVEDAHTFAFKHTVKASAIDEAVINLRKSNMHGVLYAIAGNTASSTQFYLTDSTKHYLRGALYFYEKPRMDSIQPVLDFINQDIRYMIKTAKWK